MITIEKINEVYIRVYSDPGIEQELADYFTFQVDGYKFMPAYRSGVWDGKMRLYNLQKKTLYVGLLKYVMDFAERNQYEVKSYQHELTPVTVESMREYTDWLNLCARGQKIEIREYQLQAIAKALTDERVVLLSPTSSGKSLIIYTAMRHHLDLGRKCIVIVPTTSLVAQLYKDFEDYSAENGWRADKHCQILYSGFTKDFTKDVLITTWQSIYKQPAQWGFSESARRTWPQ
jgi:superfamily II DNA or RNA helicase